MQKKTTTFCTSYEIVSAETDLDKIIYIPSFPRQGVSRTTLSLYSFHSTPLHSTPERPQSREEWEPRERELPVYRSVSFERVVKGKKKAAATNRQLWVCSRSAEPLIRYAAYGQRPGRHCWRPGDLRRATRIVRFYAWWRNTRHWAPIPHPPHPLIVLDLFQNGSCDSKN